MKASHMLRHQLDVSLDSVTILISLEEGKIKLVFAKRQATDLLEHNCPGRG
jgi:hypothetical protein